MKSALRKIRYPKAIHIDRKTGTAYTIIFEVL